MGDRDYQAAIAKGLSEALDRAAGRTWDLERERVIVFSDLHRGQGDHADDFRTSADTYQRALEFYLVAGYRLVVLGDAEELWEGWPRKVIPTYRDSLQLEARFFRASADRYIRVWGNHDDLWQFPHRVAKHLAPIYGELPVHEGLDITVTRGDRKLGRLFLVHGHQGTAASDRWGKFSRHFVRWVWRPVQRLFKIRLNTPATNFEIRGKHDRAMYEWAAARNDLVLVAGHTHNPVFVSQPHVATLERVRRHLRDHEDPSSDSAKQIEEEIAWARREGDRDGDEAPPARDRSCYFNSGCCCFSNGDITGIEFADGEIRLVRWTTGPADPDNRIVEARNLASVFGSLGS